jgi:hypothetical protein
MVFAAQAFMFDCTNQNCTTMKKLLSRVMILILSVPGAAYAHDGHGHTDGDSPEHYLTEPYHIIIVLAAVAIIGALMYRRSKQAGKQ